MFLNSTCFYVCRIYSIKNGKQKKCYTGSIGNDGTIIRVRLDPAGMYAATSCSDKNLCIFDFFTGEMVASMMGHSEIATGLQFTNDLKHLISVAGDGWVWGISVFINQLLLCAAACRVLIIATYRYLFLRLVSTNYIWTNRKLTQAILMLYIWNSATLASEKLRYEFEKYFSIL